MKQEQSIEYLEKYYNDIEIPPILELIRNPNINPVIIKRFTKLSYNNEFPFNVRIYGSYPLTADWELLEAQIEHLYFPEYTKEAVHEYLKQFAIGFKYGYSQFENNIVIANTTFDNQKNRVQKTFDYLTATNYIPYFRGQFVGGNFPKKVDSKEHVFSGWKDSGIKAGYFYRAWCLVFENHKMFEPLFLKNFGKVEEPMNTKDRKNDLSGQIKEMQVLLNEYEHKEILEDDPKRKMKLCHEIENIKLDIKKKTKELAQLG